LEFRGKEHDEGVVIFDSSQTALDFKGAVPERVCGWGGLTERWLMPEKSNRYAG
jgi:hypothetical protein